MSGVEQQPGPAVRAAGDTVDASGPTPRRTYFPGLEGLRALAASAVVLHHSVTVAWPQYDGRPLAQVPFLAKVGHVSDGGVAVFFVLSGFLIYRPYVLAHLQGRLPLPARRFYWRRALRIVPAYWVALTFFWAIGQFSLGGPGTAWRYYAFAQIYSRSTVLGGIVPAWSLGTEMSFYLLVPAYAWALAALGRTIRRAAGPGRASAAEVPEDGRGPDAADGVDQEVDRRALVELVLGALLVASGYLARAAVSAADPSWRPLSFNWLLTNIDFFGAGMVVAVLSAWAAARSRAPRWSRTLGRSPELCWAAAVLLFVWFAVRIGPASFEVGYKGGYWQLRAATLTAISLLLLLPSVFGDQDRGPVRRVLRWGPVHWVGLVSYGLYLWHLPFLDRLTTQRNLVTGRPDWTGWVSGPIHLPTALLVAFGLGLTGAAASYYLVEQPLQRFKDRV